ncbi:ComEA family DNA-binding protein [Streptomyces sp. NPDC001595]|uniref:ComEA family DNA-binding protein n=1 Tax=Streptomyces sp. NPDC001532 TaxID=3154520 RepID=UPI00332DE83C
MSAVGASAVGVAGGSWRERAGLALREREREPELGRGPEPGVGPSVEPESGVVGEPAAASVAEASAVGVPSGSWRERAGLALREWERERGREPGVGPSVEPGSGVVGEPAAASVVEASAVGVPGGSWRERAGLALRERMPLWLQARVGLERRSVVALTVLLVVAAGFAAQHFWSGRTETVPPPEVVEAAAAREHGHAGGGPEAGSTAAPGVAVGATPATEIVVDVSGKVREPGIHRLPAGARVVDALEAAGGVRPGTDLRGLNRARFLVDGEQVVVGGPASAAAPPAGAPATGTAPAGPVSLNTATVKQLDTLPGVGPVLAQHIVDYRIRHGGFRSVDELREVNGIGERRFADLRNLVQP